MDASGKCQWCRKSQVPSAGESFVINKSELLAMAERIKGARTGKYDCIIGVSGGLDSSYMAYIAAKYMGLNALLVHYDHGFFYDDAHENLQALAKDLHLDLRVYKSARNWDKRYVRAIVSAFSRSGYYWGICSLCHYILPAAIIRIGLAEGIPYYLSHSNNFETSLGVSGQFKLKAMLQGVLAAGILHLPGTLFNLLLAQYYFLRIKLEFYIPPIQNLFKRSPCRLLNTINLTRYVHWDIERMVADLSRDTGWTLPAHPTLGMRFDCMIEDSYLNATYQRATGLTVHAIIANNLIRAGVKSKTALAPVVEYYDNTIQERITKVKEMALKP